MKNVMMILLLQTLSLSAFATSYDVIARDQDFKLAQKVVTAQELGLDEQSESEAEGFSSFRIHRGTDENPINTNELDNDGRLRYFTMAYHLNRAINYFNEVMGAEQFNKIGKLTVRLDIAKNFNPGKHFNTKDMESNNAVTIKPSNDNILDGIKPWNFEVWFRPAKSIKVQMPAGSIAGNGGDVIDDLLGMGDNILVAATKEYALTQRLNANYYEDLTAQMALNFAIKKLVPKAIDFIFSSIPTSTKLDTAMVPEIIYHEMTHVAMSDYIAVNGSYGVSEGMANYFAAIILGTSAVGDKLGKYGKNVGAYKPNKGAKYNMALDLKSENAHNPFVFSYLWTLREKFIEKQNALGIADAQKVFDKIVFNSRKYIDPTADSAIIKMMCKGLMESATEVISNPTKARAARMLIQRTGVDFGM